MNYPINPSDRRRISRRTLIAGAGGAVAAGMFAASGGIASARRPSVARAAIRAGRRPASGEPTLSQWYHGYGEAGVQEAVEGYAAAYEEATVNVEWFPADYDSALASALLTDEGPDVFEIGNGPTIDMILSGQVVPLDGVLGDAESDFNERLLSRLTYDGHLWAVPQIIDMYFLVYRKSHLADAGIEPPTTMDELIAAAAALTSDDRKGLFLGNDGGVGPLGGMALWSAGADYLTEDGQFGFDNDAVYASFAKLRELYESDSLLLGAPADWSAPDALISELTSMQLTGLWTFPQLTEAFGDDFDAMPWPALDASTGSASVPIGAFSSAVSARSVDVDAAKAFVKWLWVDQTDLQNDFATSYGFHIPARNSLADAADVLQDGAAATALQLYQEYAFTQIPVLWTPAADTAYADARTRIIAEGADPAEEIARVKEIVEAELERIGAGASGSSAPASSEPTSTDISTDSTAGATAESSAPATTG